jgi:prepilin-type N-terminal cleavage/methylation domain-containing protein
MNIGTRERRRSQAGFSLIELLIVVAILTVIMGAVFTQLVDVQKRFRSEEAKLDLSQEGREVMDTLVRDLRQVGYPNAAMYAGGIVNNTSINNAAGFVQFSPTELWFEGDVDGDGQVEQVHYQWQPGDNGSCPCRLQRSQVPRLALPPFSAGHGKRFITALDNILNSGGQVPVGGTTSFRSGDGIITVNNNQLYGAYTTQPIFQAFTATGAAVGATTDPGVLRTIKSIRITFNLLAPPASELQTMIRPALSLTATARINQ